VAGLVSIDVTECVLDPTRRIAYDYSRELSKVYVVEQARTGRPGLQAAGEVVR